MQRFLAILAILLTVGMVLIRVSIMKRHGIKAMRFGALDKRDYLIPPFALFYFYTIFAAAFGFPVVSKSEMFHSDMVSWLGDIVCLVGLAVVLWSLISFGKSFRIGIDSDRPDTLVTDGVFAYSRNPIYVAFALTLLGQFLVYPNWVLLIYVIAGVWLFNRQVLLEEQFLAEQYGERYREYCRKVRRYI